MLRAAQADGSAPRLTELLPLLVDQHQGRLSRLCLAVAACVAQRLAVLRERELRAVSGCPLLTADDDGVTAAEALDDACAFRVQCPRLYAGTTTHPFFSAPQGP